jgi:hypothetical protein
VVQARAYHSLRAVLFAKTKGTSVVNALDSTQSDLETVYSLDRLANPFHTLDYDDALLWQQASDIKLFTGFATY